MFIEICIFCLFIIIFYFLWLNILKLFNFFVYNFSFINVYLFKEPIYYINIIIPLFIFFWFNIITIINSYINTDISFINIIINSSVSEALLYKFIGWWGNQEGSFLLWNFFIFLYLFIFLLNFNFNFFNLNFKILILQSIHIIFFIILLIFYSNPFLKSLYYNNFKGQLNPILQDPIFAIHPPFLYFGYLGSSILFSIGIIILIYKVFPYIYIYYLKLFTYISWSILTLGIGLGSWWAYYELGWGGWWFWDPVENISLIPWFLLTALLHNIIIGDKYNYNINYILFFTLFTYIFSILGTYFIKSGLLTSVHSFAEDSISSYYYLFFIIFLFFLILFFFRFSLFIFTEPFVFSNIYFIKIINYIFIFIIIIFLFSIFLPLLPDYLNFYDITFTYDFFNKIFYPLLGILIILMILSTISTISFQFLDFFNYKVDIYKYKFFFLVYFFYFFLFFLFNISFIMIIYLFLLIITIILNFFLLILRIKFKLMNYMIYGHITILLFLFFMILNLFFQKEINYIINIGEKIFFEEYYLIFRNLYVFELDNYKLFLFDFLINKNNELLDIFFPEQHFYFKNKAFIYKPYVDSFLYKDIYLILEEGNLFNGWYLKLIFNYAITEMWTSLLFIIFVGFSYIYKLFNINNSFYNKYFYI